MSRRMSHRHVSSHVSSQGGLRVPLPILMGWPGPSATYQGLRQHPEPKKPEASVSTPDLCAFSNVLEAES
jgi:hypothetical protein